MRRNVDSGVERRNLSVIEIEKINDFNYVFLTFLIKEGSSFKSLLQKTRRFLAIADRRIAAFSVYGLILRTSDSLYIRKVHRYSLIIAILAKLVF